MNYMLFIVRVELFLLLTLNKFYTLFWCFYCLLRTNKYRLGTSLLTFFIFLTFFNFFQTEHNLKKEKDAKAKLDKEKRKVEAELKETKDKLADTENDLKNLRDTVAK